MTRRILSIDGGGIRGILPAALLVALEGRLGKPICDAFDLIAGTSTGGIIGCGLAIALPATQLVDLYVNKGGGIFARNIGDEIASVGGVAGPKYQATALEAELKAVLGDAWLSDVKTRLLVPSYCIQLPRPMDLDGDGLQQSAGSWLFASWFAQNDDAEDFQLWQVGRATSAAPTYFPAARIVNMLGAVFYTVDGGVFANNPAGLAIAKAKQLWPGEDILCVSIGTGGNVTAFDGAAAQAWGDVQWAPVITSASIDGSADAVSISARSEIGAKYVRAQIALSPPVNDAFDDASPSNIAALVDLGKTFVAQHLDRIETALA